MNYYTFGESVKANQNEVTFHNNQRLENITTSTTSKVKGISKWNIFRSTQKSIA